MRVRCANIADRAILGATAGLSSSPGIKHGWAEPPRAPFLVESLSRQRLFEFLERCEHLGLMAVDLHALPYVGHFAGWIDQIGAALNAHGDLAVHVLFVPAPYLSAIL